MCFVQFEFELSSKIGTKYCTMKVKNDILPQNVVDKLRHDICLGLFEKQIKLTPEIERNVQK